jgi:hypothetical protein
LAAPGIDKLIDPFWASVVNVRPENSEVAFEINHGKDIHHRLLRLEALFARGGTAGERAAAGAAIERMQPTWIPASDHF